jgi:SNF2 family DNA or RNA helicase
MLELLEQDMTAEGKAWYSITGETPKEKRTELVEKFNHGDVPVFFISLRAGGTGLNLTGADVVIHYDPWWNLAVQKQATDRAHRIGQQRNVTVYRLIMKGTVEERVLAMQEAKMKLAEDILGTGTAGPGAITKEELLELLSGDTYVQQAGG